MSVTNLSHHGTCLNLAFSHALGVVIRNRLLFSARQAIVVGRHAQSSLT
jgi:hypothetical protein